MTSKYRKKLIEVALPLEAINVASAREKSIRHGHPSTLHLWWARRPLAACRAVLFASLVNDPEDDPMYGISEDVAFTERAKLLDLIEELVQWDNSNNPRVINAARLEIARSIAANKVADKELNDDTPLVANAPKLPDEQTKYLPESPPEYTPRDVRFKMPSLKPEQVNHFLIHYAPPVLDPFSGGGSIPLEAQRLGLRAFASDLNPVPVLINKALIEIPSKFADQPPVNPDSQLGKLTSKIWQGTEGLAEDVRYYGKWIRAQAEKRIGHLYPKVQITKEMADDGRPDLLSYVGRELSVVAWIWARTMPTVNPAVAGGMTPLVSSFWLSKKKGKEVWLTPKIDGTTCTFEVNSGELRDGVFESISKGTIGRSGATCIFTNSPITLDQVRQFGQEGKLGTQMIAIVAEGTRERVFLKPNEAHLSAASVVAPENILDTDIPSKALGFRVHNYGIDKHRKLYTNRQLTGLYSLCELVKLIRQEIAKVTKDEAYSDAISLYLAMVVSRTSGYSSTLCPWGSHAKDLLPKHVFGRQTLSMVWDFAETNILGDSGGAFDSHLQWTANAINCAGSSPGVVLQRDAAKLRSWGASLCISTDPPYYDNIGYADLSDYFYVWLRESLRSVFPDILATALTPKNEEAIANPGRFDGDKEASFRFFESKISDVFDAAYETADQDIPVTIFYAFKQSETDSLGTASTGWETFLSGVIESGFSITATWPIRTELSNRMRSTGSNALASSIVLACKKRSQNALSVTRRDFANSLRHELPNAIKHLQSGNVAPVDLAQASIGPGMAVFSRYSKVINADGTPMTVREALQLINQVLDESLIEQESDFDSETRFALKWFEQYGLGEGPFGDAENLSKAMAVSVKGIEDAGILRSKAGKVRLLKREELAPDWDPASDSRLTMWEVGQHLIRTLEADGESGTADLLRRIGSEKGDIARELAYRLYQTCERKSLAKEAGAYNALVVSWPEISRLSQQKSSTLKQSELELTD
jgi:putative DNA methylase